MDRFFVEKQWRYALFSFTFFFTDSKSLYKIIIGSKCMLVELFVCDFKSVDNRMTAL